MNDESAVDTVMLCLRVPATLKQRLAELSADAGVTIQSIGRRAIEVELDTREALLADAAERERRIRAEMRKKAPHRES